MSDEPSSWGEDSDFMPSSLTMYGETPQYQPNFTKNAAVKGSGENNPAEVLENLIDNDSRTKWLTFEKKSFFEIQLSNKAAANLYTITSANDFPNRDPKSWQLFGSQNARDWHPLDKRSNVIWDNRLETKLFFFENKTTFTFYRLEITGNAGADETQIAEFELRRL
jgi:hypothetical protein